MKKIQKLNLEELPSILTIGEVATLFRVKTTTIQRWTNTGRLECFRINSRGDRRFRKEEIYWFLLYWL